MRVVRVEAEARRATGVVRVSRPKRGAATSQNVSDFLIERLSQWGVKRIYGFPGDGINGIAGALNRRGGDPAFVQARHEELAAFMASAHAKWTGEVGVCLATSGPGAVHLLNGLYDARMDHQPVVAIVGQQARLGLGSAYQQEIDLVSLYKDVAAEFVQLVSVPAQMRHVVDRAMRIAMGERTVTAIIIPNDLQTAAAVPEPPRTHGAVYSGIGFSKPVVVPTDADLQHAADILNEGERVAMLIGQGARDAADEVVATAELLGAGVAKALLGKDVIPDDLPWVTGSIGLLGTRPSWDLMQECDTLLMIGTSFPYAEFLPPEDQAVGVQIDIDPRMIGVRYPMQANLLGDSRETLKRLLPLLRRKERRDWRQKVEANVRDWWELMDERAQTKADPVNPQWVLHELSPRLPDDVIIACDTGSVANWYARDVKLRTGMRASLSGNLATMGPAMPYAIAAKFTHPDRPVVALVGDGAMQMNGMNGLITVAKYWREWKNPRLAILVLNNRDLNQVTWEQRAMEGDPKFEASQDLPDVRYADYAKLLGLDGRRVESAAEVGSAWDAVLEADIPTVLEVVTDPNVPPLPPHITLEQAKHFAFAIAKGDPDGYEVASTSIKEMLAGVLSAR
jgi:pyruvate dehydrogenase (quinone)